MSTHQQIGACAVALSRTGGLHLIPAGEFDAAALQGEGPWRLDQPAAMRLIRAAQERGLDIPIDYEHQTLHTAENGRPAPASGWIDPAALAWDESRGLVAESVRWTDAAAAMLDAQEYRYLSPVFSYAKDGTVLELLHAALTNKPALNQLDPVALQAAATRYNRPEEDHKDMTKEHLAALRQALGLPADADGDAMLAALNKQVESVAAAVAGLGAANKELAALKEGSPDPKKYAPVAALKTVQTELAALRAANEQREVEDLVAPALDDGRLLPGLETWARDLGKSDRAALKAYLDAAKPIAALSGSQTGGTGPGSAADADPEKTAETAWEQDAALRREFPDRGAYVAYCKAKAGGRLHVRLNQEDKQ